MMKKELEAFNRAYDQAQELNNRFGVLLQRADREVGSLAPWTREKTRSYWANYRVLKKAFDETLQAGFVEILGRREEARSTFVEQTEHCLRITRECEEDIAYLEARLPKLDRVFVEMMR